MTSKTIFVTGGAGFIGSNLVRFLITKSDYKVVVIDKLTYAGNKLSLTEFENNERFVFELADICNAGVIRSLFDKYKPFGVMHLAAETHVDRSIDGPGDFITTNIIGTYTLLEESIKYWEHELEKDDTKFKFLHVSTDEVFGSLGNEGAFDEKTAYDPKSPYSASKASSDHLVRAWNATFGLPVLITNCSNNYGPYQFPEKLIPLVILKALRGEKIPVYGTGENVRDWLYVEDHAKALKLVFETGKIGETYAVGGNNELTNISLVNKICEVLDELKPLNSGHYNNLIEFVTDRPGHDLRYAIDATKIKTELGFTPTYEFNDAIKQTVKWYVKNQEWCATVLENKYNIQRLGVIK